jgi:hypothetical protein
MHLVDCLRRHSPTDSPEEPVFSVRITDIALACTDYTTVFVLVVRKANSRYSPDPPLRVTVRGRQMPAKAKGGRRGRRARTSAALSAESSAYSAKEVAGTRQRNSALSQARQLELPVLRTLVTDRAPKCGSGRNPQRAISMARTCGAR